MGTGRKNMSRRSEDESAEAAWREVVEASDQLAQAMLTYDKAKRDFLRFRAVRGAILRRELRTRHWKPALDTAQRLSDSEHLDLLPELLRLSTVGHGMIGTVRTIITSAPRSEVLQRIEAEVEPYLIQGTDEDYRRVIELFLLLDTQMAETLANRAAKHTDPEISEVGREFLLKLQSP